jgi:diguanylate cyclase (GGDEF)-like protein
MKWSERSMSSWIAIGMGLTVLPLVVSAIVVHVWFHGAALADLDDIATRYRDESGPLRELQIALWEAAVPVEEYLDAREATQPGAYREQRIRIEGLFVRLDQAFAREPPLRKALGRAEESWSEADRVAGDLLAHPGPPGDPVAIERADHFNALVGAAADVLRAVDRDVHTILDADHAAADRSNERSKWATAIAAGLSLITMIVGITIIMRILLANLTRLVDGARKFAEGDRGHRIEVQVPPELREVADEFNRMIARVHEAEASLMAQAREDAMTGLRNRRAFEESLTAAFARTRRLSEPFALVTLDVDHFKKVNDTYGHSAGDDVLKSIGRTVERVIREVDQAFRIGGDEFAVLLAGVDLAGAKVAAERLRAAIAASPVATGGTQIAVTASFGLACADRAIPADELMRSVDLALYAAKSGGRNRVVTASDTAAAAARA